MATAKLKKSEWKRISKAAKELAFEVAAGGEVALESHNWDDCALGEVRRRANIKMSSSVFGPKLEGILEGRKAREVFDTGHGMLSDATRAQTGWLRDPATGSYFGSISGAIVFPLLALADKASKKAKSVIRR